MGSAFSCGQDNDDLVNILIVLGYIKSKQVERVFREVDRGDYVLPCHRDLAYKDLSWKIGNIHLSAPCVYSKVMEGLSLKPGLSFLNIGSGTGYLSTMAGLILGENGTNHGIEMHEDCLTYAYEHLEAFKEKSLNVDGFEFCEPAFQLGNFLNVIPNRQYDRVYCGAACPEIHEKFVKQFVRVGGILVMPYKYNLLRIERINETTWRNHTMLPVSFTMLATPQEENERGLLNLPLCHPTTLQELCRGSIRRHLRKIVWSEHSYLEQKTVIQPQAVVDRPPPQLHFGYPFVEESNQEAHRREVVTSMVQIVRVVQPDDERDYMHRDPDTSEDSDEVVDRSEIDLFDLFCARNEPEDSTKDTETTETEMQEDRFEEAPHTPMEEDDHVEAAGIANQGKSAASEATKDVSMENDNSDQAENLFDRSSESKLKRRKSEEPSSSNESNESGDNKLCRLFIDNDIPEEAQNGRISDSCSPVPVASISDADDDDEDDLNFAIIKKAFSILKDKFDTKMEEATESKSSDSSSEKTNGRDCNNRDSSVGVKNAAEKSSHIRCVEGARNADADVDDSDLSESPFSRQANSQMSEKGSSNRVGVSREKKMDNLLSDKNCSDDEGKNKSPGSDDRRAPRNRRSVDDTKTNEVSDSSSDTSSDDERFQSTLYPRFRRSSQKRRSDERESESSGSKESSDLRSQSPISSSSNSLSDENGCNADLHFYRGKQLKRHFAHKIHKEALTVIMRSKIGQLPLPLPLRLYMNYNREL